MGLFGWKSKAEKEKNAAGKKSADTLQSYSGIRVEVLSRKNESLFMAKLVIGSNGLAELQPVSENAGPVMEEDDVIHVLLRGFDETKQKAVHLEGDASRISGTIWRVEHLRIMGSENDRASYRQDVGSAGEVMLFGQPGMPQVKTCIVLNISAGGALIQADAVFEVGNKLLLRSRLVPNSEMALLCTVCRIVERRPGVYEYGCRFDSLDPNAEEQISKSIVQLQMKRTKR